MEAKESRQDRIRDVFQARMSGWGPLRTLAERCIADGLYSPTEMEGQAVRAIMRDCARALKASDDRGLPYALPSRDGAEEDGGGPAWGQLDLLPYDDEAYYIVTEASKTKADAVKVIRIRDHCLLRHGNAPDLPESLEVLAHA